MMANKTMFNANVNTTIVTIGWDNYALISREPHTYLGYN